MGHRTPLGEGAIGQDVRHKAQTSSPHVVSLDFIEVQGGKPDLHVPRLLVCGLRGGYMVHNLREGRGGVYCRRGPGPEFTQGPLI